MIKLDNCANGCAILVGTENVQSAIDLAIINDVSWVR